MKKIISVFFIFIMITMVLVGCNSTSNSIQTCVILNASYTIRSELQKAKQEQPIKAGQPVYASIHFIKSPKEMEYSVKWYLDGNEIKSETKETTKNTQDILVYELQADKATTGKLKLEVLYKDS